MGAGTKKVMWGLLILSFHIDFFGIQVFPAFVGTLFALNGFSELAGEERASDRLWKAGMGAACVLLVAQICGLAEEYLGGQPQWIERLSAWQPFFVAMLEYGAFWCLADACGRARGWGGEYGRRLFFYQLTMAAGAAFLLAACFFREEGFGVGGACLALAARFQLFYALSREDHPAPETDGDEE